MVARDKLIPITDELAIGQDELREVFVRAGGPGGQNVNKVSTAAQLYFDVAHSPSLPAPVKARLTQLAGKRMNRAGVLMIEASRSRSQEQNRLDARERLVDLIRRAAKPPRPRVRTRPTRASRERRLERKRQRSERKLQRGPVSPERE